MAAATANRTGFDTESRPLTLGGVLNAAPWSFELATTNIDDNNDAVNMGYIPKGSKLLGFIAGADDLDSSTALVWKISVGGVDVKTGITIGQAAASLTHALTQFLSIEPLEITADSLVTITFTTAAGTPVAGGIWLTPVYVGV